ncbi:MAG: FMN-binding negative transcriptional regulator [Verrucomicrobia bacterium]|nr:FMN-binding negative transcriptional regulator [Verrucomicrobiota bacterium]
MYVPAHFEESRPEILRALIAAHPLGTLVTLGSTGLNANHLPFELAPAPAPFGTLRAHVARANPVWQDFSREVDALVIFQGPQAYITPTWYETKKESGKVVPTWNYCVVHASGPLRIIDDPAWVRAMVERLTQRFEAHRAAPWNISDAPADFIARQVAAIVGIEIPVGRLIGKWKVSQNRPPADREGVADGLLEETDADAVAMSELVRNQGRKPPA